MRNNLGESCRGLDFDFGDCDSLLVELEEQYRKHFSTFTPKFKISNILNYKYCIQIGNVLKAMQNQMIWI